MYRETHYTETRGIVAAVEVSYAGRYYIISSERLSQRQLEAWAQSQWPKATMTEWADVSGNATVKVTPEKDPRWQAMRRTMEAETLAHIYS